MQAQLSNVNHLNMTRSMPDVFKGVSGNRLTAQTSQIEDNLEIKQ